MSMEIARLYRSRIQEAVDLVWETFLKFEVFGRRNPYIS